MELTNSFRLEMPIDDAWNLLTDIERIAPCMPGAQLEEVEGDEHRGAIKVKVGPITTRYRGSARIKELEDDTHRAVIVAEGDEVGGQGTAGATITATLEADGSATRVEMATDLQITGKVAQFGRGMMSDISGRLLEEFVANLERGLYEEATTPVRRASEGSRGAEPTTASAPGGPSAVEAGTREVRPEPESLDLLGIVVAPAAKRALPAVGLLVLAVLARRWWRRH